MNWHRLLCAVGCHYFVRLEPRRRGCCVCHQQQAYAEDAWGRGGWFNVAPQGRAVDSTETA